MKVKLVHLEFGALVQCPPPTAFYIITYRPGGSKLSVQTRYKTYGIKL